MKNRHFSIRFNLSFYTIVCFFIFLATISGIASAIYSTSISNIIDNQIINTSKQVVSNYELYFTSAIEVSNSLQAKLDNMLVFENKPAVQSYFDDVRLIKGEIISISLYDEDGNYIVANSGFHTEGKENIYNTDSFQNAINEPLINIFSAVEVSDNRYAFTLSRTLSLNREGRSAVVLIEFDFTKIVQLIYQSDLGENGHILIYDREYNVVYSSAPSFIEEDLKRAEELVLGTDSVSINGQYFNLYISTITHTGWTVAVFTNNSQVYNALTNFIVIVVIITILLSIVYAIIVYYIVKQVTYPLYRLQREMDKVRDLNYEVTRSKIRKGSKEIVQLDNTFNEMMKRIRDLASKIVQEQENQRKSELKALQNQINPHFLYNTLDSIIYMIDKGENKKAEEMIVALSKFFRISISRGRTIIPIEKEIEHVKNYLLIQKIRFGDEFTYTIDVDPEIYNYYSIKLILQPLVENAIEHGLSKSNKEGEIKIKGSIDDKFIILSVSDDGYGISEEKLEEIYKNLHEENVHKGVGIKNVYQRIKIYYGEEADLKIESILDEGTTISIYIPKEKAKNYEEK